MNKASATLLALVFGIVLLPIGFAGAVYYGWVLTYLWGWFIVPTFHAPVLSVAQAAGISSVIGFITSPILSSLATKPDDSEKAISACIGVLIGPLISLLLGWIIHRFLF